MSISHTHALSFAVFAAISLAPFAGVRAADEPAAPAAEAAAGAEDSVMKEELAYINALVEASMPDFADPVIAAAKKKWPSLGPKLKVLELQGTLLLGKFDEVQKVLAAMKQKNGEYWALRLKMADAYYSRGMMPECRKIYQEFFKTVPKPGPDLIDFYVESGFRWAQICVNEKNFDEGIRMFQALLDKIPNEGDTEERWCTVAMETVSLLIRLAEEIDPAAGGKDAKKLGQKRAGYLKTATELVNKLLWKNELILVFGKAIAMKAHIELLNGNLEKAQGLVNDYMPDLKKIHDNLLEQDPTGKEGYMRISPMPECRYLLAKVMWDAVQNEMKQAKPDLKGKVADLLFGPKQNGKRNGAGAYNHAVNVFVKYPEASCASNAGELADAIEKFVKAKFGKTIKTNITPEQKKKVRQMQFDNAYENYRNGEYAKAVKAYGDILVQFPEVEESIGAVGIIADSYLNLWQVEKDAAKKVEWRLSAEAAEGYLAERFSGLKPEWIRPAGDELLRLAAKESDMGEKARMAAVYDLYFRNFPTHYNAAQTALTLADRAYSKEDWAEASRYYGVVATQFTNSTHRARAVAAMFACAEKMGERELQKQWMGEYVKVAPTVSARTSSQLKLALMQQKDAFAAFASAAETNDAEVVATVRKQASRDVIGAIRNFTGVATEIAAEMEKNKGLTAKEKESFALLREQAMFLVGDSFQQLSKWVDEKKRSAFCKKAVGEYEKYLAAFPSGRYGAPILMKIATIHTADQETDKAKDAFARLQKNFPESDEAKNSVPRFAQELIKLGRNEEGVAQYKLMLETKGGKYSAGQFLAAGDALLETKGWEVAGEAYARAIELSASMTGPAVTSIVSRCQLGQAKVSFGQKQYVIARQKLDDFVEKYPKSRLVLDAFEMLVEVASIEGSTEKDDEARQRLFNVAVRSVKQIRKFKEPRVAAAKAAYDAAVKAKAETQDSLRKAWTDLRDELYALDLRSADVQVRKMGAEEGMSMKEQADVTCRKAIAMFQAFLMSHEPNESNPLDGMTQREKDNLERCYSTVLPLLAKLGKANLGEELATKAIEYGVSYEKYFPDGKNKVAVQNAMNQLKAE